MNDPRYFWLPLLLVPLAFGAPPKGKKKPKANVAPIKTPTRLANPNTMDRPSSPKIPKRRGIVRRAAPLEIIRGRGLTRRVLMIVDTSGSMRLGNRISDALHCAEILMTMPTDVNVEFGIITFAATHTRWAGVKLTQREMREARRGQLPDGWAIFPSLTNVKRALGWLQSFKKGGLTHPASAILEAMKERRRKLSIILISDGDFDLPEALSALKKGQAWRRRNKLDKAPLMTFGVGDNAKEMSTLRVLGKRGRGGFWVASRRRHGPF